MISSKAIKYNAPKLSVTVNIAIDVAMIYVQVRFYYIIIYFIYYKHLIQNIPDCPQEKEIKKPLSDQICENGKLKQKHQSYSF